MDIVCSIDNNYVQHCCVMLSSFFENNLGEKHSIHLLTEGIGDGNKKLIEKLIASYQGQFFYYVIDSDFLQSCPIKESDHLTIATYYRLFMTNFLPVSVEKVLYLDCDIVINGSIKELWNTDLHGYALAAVEEMGCSAPDVYERLNYNESYGYFNAGVLLINLEYWRTERLVDTFIGYITKNVTKLIAHDQDVLNGLLHAKCLHVSCKWNVEEAFYHYSVMKRLRSYQDLNRILRQPVILHYTWKPKPWDLSCKHPFRINYFIYMWKTYGKKGSPQLSIWQKIIALKDKYVFCLLLKLGITGHRFYQL